MRLGLNWMSLSKYWGTSKDILIIVFVVEKSFAHPSSPLSDNSLQILSERRRFHAGSFFPRVSTSWNRLPRVCFPKHYNLNHFVYSQPLPILLIHIICIYSPLYNNLIFSPSTLRGFWALYWMNIYQKKRELKLQF